MKRLEFALARILTLSAFLFTFGCGGSNDDVRGGGALDQFQLLLGKVSNGMSKATDRVSGKPMRLFSTNEYASDAGMERLRDPGVPFGLRLRKCKVTDQGLASIGRLTSLTFLDLSDSRRFTDVGLAHLRNLTNLSELRLTNTAISDAGIAELQSLSNLCALILRYVDKMTDAGLKHISGLSHLVELDLAHSNVTEAGVAELKRALPKCNIRRE